MSPIRPLSPGMRSPHALRWDGSLVLALLALSACADRDGQRGPSHEDITAVYEAVVATDAPLLLIRKTSGIEESLLADYPAPAGLAGGAGKTMRELRASEIRTGLTGLRADTWESFVAANATRRDLSDTIHFESRVEWVSDEQVQHDLRGDLDAGYRRLFLRYAGATELIRVSSPGWNRDSTQALIYVESLSGGESGGATYFLLDRASGGWRIAETLQAWVA